MLIFSFLLILSWLSRAVFANTEIRNFGAAETFPVLDASTHQRLSSGDDAWVTELNATTNERRFDVIPARLWTPLKDVCASYEAGYCPTELWLRLNLSEGGWARYGKFTLRISWPAFHPTDFGVSFFDLKGEPQTKLARIRLVDTGVRAPSADARPGDPPPWSLSFSSPSQVPVPFIVILEPLYFGVIPATIIPILSFMIPTVVLAGAAVPWVLRHLRRIAADAQRELHELRSDKVKGS